MCGTIRAGRGGSDRSMCLCGCTVPVRCLRTWQVVLATTKATTRTHTHTLCQYIPLPSLRSSSPRYPPTSSVALSHLHTGTHRSCSC